MTPGTSPGGLHSSQGGSRGIGRVDALTLARAGADVVIADILLESDSEEVERYGALTQAARARGMVCWRAVWRQMAERKWGRIREHGLRRRDVGRVRAGELLGNDGGGDAAAGEPEDVANAIASLCSDLAGYVNRRVAERERRDRALHVLGGFGGTSLVVGVQEQPRGGQRGPAAQPSFRQTLLAPPRKRGRGKEDWAELDAKMTGLELEAAIRTMPARRRTSARVRMLRYGFFGVAALAVLLTAIGFAFSGSSSSLPKGATIAGVDVGGLTPREAQKALEQRALELREVPVTFIARDRRFAIRPARLALEVDWAAAVEAARRQGEGFGPVQGLRRIGVRVFGTDVSPAVDVYEPALERVLNRIATGVDDPGRDASIRLRGLEPVIVKGREGTVVDRQAATQLIVQGLSGFERKTIALPTRIDRPSVRAADLVPVAAQVKVALSEPVRLTLGPTAYKIPRWRIAKLLVLPQDGRRALAVGGPYADRYFKRLERTVAKPARSADFEVTAAGGIKVVPHRSGRELHVEKTSRALLAAALAPLPNARVAAVEIVSKAPPRTTAEAKGMGITDLVGGYTTEYGGIANRIHNVQLVSRLIDRTLIAPGAQFSFNETTGERTPEKGFLEAPVIINGELQNGLGGGVCQVSTTVFNAAYEAGLPIDSRTNHALYISHYPQGRDATVNYPDLDLRFRNDTDKWLLLRTFVGSSSLTVNLYGTPTGRRVESETGPLVVTGPAPVKRTSDPTLPKGQTVIDQSGSPSRSTSVRRKVFSPTGKLMYDATWYSSYRGEYQVVRVGTKEPEPKAKKKEHEKEKENPEARTTTTGATTTPEPLPQP